MRHYEHLSIDERENILILRTEGHSLRAIAGETKRSVSTVLRELKRIVSLMRRARLQYRLSVAVDARAVPLHSEWRVLRTLRTQNGHYSENCV